MEQSDYDRLDPEERSSQYLAIGSAALGVLSFCTALLPICGISFSIIAAIMGYASRKSTYRYAAYAGMAFSAIGFLTALVYGFLTVFAAR